MRHRSTMKNERALETEFYRRWPRGLIENVGARWAVRFYPDSQIYEYTAATFYGVLNQIIAMDDHRKAKREKLV
jgi:hypothetical protein